MRLSDDHIRHLRSLVDQPDLSGTKYRYVRKIGSGGMGTVYLVDDTDLHRQVAMKVLSLPDPSGDLTRRLVREARIIATLEHPGIAPVHDFGRLSDGRVYYVMKYVQGTNLLDHAKTVTSLTDRLRLIQRICEPVAFAHSRGFIHRDLKPANIMIGEFGEILVMDWGVAKTVTDAAGHAVSATPVNGATENGADDTATDMDTASGAVVGTVGFMSPEQASGRTTEIDHRSDIFALGGILFSLLTGQYPRAFDHDAERHEPTPRQINRDIPPPVEAICLAAMHRDPEQRYQSAIALADDIKRYLDKQPVSAYRENIFERGARFVSRYRFIFLLVAAYIIVRIVLYFLRDI